MFKQINKTRVVVALIAAALLLTACAESESTPFGEDNAAGEELVSDLNCAGDIVSEYRIAVGPASPSILILNDDGTDLKAMILEEISAASSGTRVTQRSEDFYSERARDVYSCSMIAEINEFYLAPAEIGGFEVNRVAMTLGVSTFYYMSSDPELRFHCPGDGSYDKNASPEIVITITNDSYSQFTYLQYQGKTTAELFSEIGENFSSSTVLIEENMLYFETAGLLHVLSDDMLISIVVPDKHLVLAEGGNRFGRFGALYDLGLNCPDFLRDIAQQVIETAELVRVDIR
jgi:hypothetical protein